MKLCEILAINLKYYRKKYNLSQEKFAEILGTSLAYLNQIENVKVDVKSSTIDRFAKNLTKYNPECIVTSDELVKYNEQHITNYTRIDEKK